MTGVMQAWFNHFLSLSLFPFAPNKLRVNEMERMKKLEVTLPCVGFTYLFCFQHLNKKKKKS